MGFRVSFLLLLNGDGGCIGIGIGPSTSGGVLVEAEGFRREDLEFDVDANACVVDQILWPLFHYHPAEITFDVTAWDAYKQANRLFAKALARDVRDGDRVWVHDYHLMLLPQLLREEIGAEKANIKIGFFLHTPFPSSEIYRILPVRNDLLLGVLHCDLIGFHTYDYARHFLSSCGRILWVTPAEIRVILPTFNIRAVGLLYHANIETGTSPLLLMAFNSKIR